MRIEFFRRVGDAMRYIVFVLGLSLLPSQSFADPRLDFVKAYVRVTRAIEDVRGRAQSELKDKANNQFVDCVRNATLFQLELRAGVAQMNSIKLSGSVGGTPQLVAQFYEQMIDLYGQMGDICGAMVAGPQPGVNYGQLAAEMPKITAGLEYLDSGLFKASPLFFGVLISETPDKEGHASHLIITKAERDELVQSIDRSFKNVDAKDANNLVSSVSIIKFYLTKKGYICADE